uniref:Putative integral membrane protein n=3 Tax=Aliivibrio salmonicida TaxID=40269 RepID=Q9ACD6_9GAMM|nr:putative integral membrane protein [Aliivibrio salmonicida]
MLVAVIHFEYKSAISEEMWAAIVPYISVIIFSVVFAYRNSDWYMPIDNEWPNFEYIIAPIKIILMSVIFAGFAFGIALSISQEEFRPAVLLELMGFGALYAGGLFVALNWHILLIGSVIITAYLAWYARFLTKLST